MQVTDKNEVEVASSFETTSKSLAIINDSIFRTADHRIEVVNHTGACTDRRMHCMPTDF